MNEKMKEFIKLCLRTTDLKALDSFKTEFETVIQFGIENDNFRLLIWNVNNSERFDEENAIREAVERLLDEEESGHINDTLNFNQLMFELHRK